MKEYRYTHDGVTIASPDKLTKTQVKALVAMQKEYAAADAAKRKPRKSCVSCDRDADPTRNGAPLRLNDDGLCEACVCADEEMRVE